MPGVMVRFPAAMLDKLDTWIAGQSVPPSRPEAIRRLIEIGLEKKSAKTD